MIFLNTTETIGIIFGMASENTTGNMFITFLIVFMLLFAMAIMFGIPLEYTALILFPYLITVATYEKQFMGLIISILFYFVFLVVKRFMFR